MQSNNKLRMAIRATAAATIFGMAAQAQAFSFSAGDVDASVYGYARLNMSYDMDENVANSGHRGGTFPTIDDSQDVDGHFGAAASQSRIGVKATHANGVMVNIEGDFMGADYTGGALRLRHAYGSYNGVLAGQTWSNYNSFVAYTPTLDFDGVVGQGGYGSRTAQLRYTTGPLSFAIEDPKGGGFANSKNGMPALSARLEDSAGGFSYAAAALVKQNAYDTGTTDDTAMGYAAFGAASMALSDMITIRGVINYTDGANGYLYRSGGADAYIDPTTGDLETITGVGGSVGATISLGGGRTINATYGQTMLDVDDLNDPTALETNTNAFINYQWTPIENVMMGVEYGYYNAENQGGEDDDANRLMFAAQYNF
ncbi:DcaP family trimeric outer membrane transporter [Marinobacter sp. DUT-1]|uniref:DcaP family trimeric outer membrane transporter n=1 Tax=Marinobacter sp. DUT-1 TaxID=3412037 RepID=UPI003D18105A